MRRTSGCSSPTRKHRALDGAAWLTALFLALTTTAPAFAATLSGTVGTADGAVVAGALVTVFNEDGTRKETVYTDAGGLYVIATSFDGNLRLRVRTPFFADQMHTLDTTPDARLRLDVVLTDRKDEAQLSDTLPASAHAATLAWSSQASKADFISQCNYCHQVGNPLTRAPRARTEWIRTVRRMQGYGALLTPDQANAVIDTLHNGFDGEPVKALQTYDYHPKLADAKIEEWLVGDGMSFIHDAEVGEDGHFYGADEGHDIIWELNPQTSEVTAHEMPDPGLPQGGLLSAFPLPLGIFTGKHGPHSLAEDTEGKFWITNALSSHLLSFDTQTKQFKQYNIGDDVLYPHTIRIDKQGIIWFTIAITNQLGRFDPKREEFTIIDLPTDGFWHSVLFWVLPRLAKLAQWLPIDLKRELHGDPNAPTPKGPMKWAVDRGLIHLPYGIDISPKDGRIWYAKLNANRIGVVDPQTLQIKEYKTPLKGPRRLRFDSAGMLWIPAFDESSLMRFDPETEKFKQFKLPVLADNEWETPYALNINPVTDDVWITSNNSDRIFRFAQDSETFVSFPSPTRVTFLRDLVFTKEGKVCSSQSNLPAYAIEDGRPSFICLDPAGGLADRQQNNGSGSARDGE